MKLDISIGEPLISGGLTLFPLFSSGPAAPDYVPAPQALASGQLAVQELDGGAAVPELLVDVVDGPPVLLIEGEMLVGIKQNRTMNVSVLVAAGAPTPVPVACVERGRWGAAQRVSRSSGVAPASLRAVKTRSMVDGGTDRVDQDAVWASVDEHLVRHAVESNTDALEDVVAVARARRFNEIEGLRPVADQVGVLMGIDGRAVALDIFDKPSTLEAYWDELVAGYLLDLPTDGAATPFDSVEAFLADVAEAAEQDVPGTGLGERTHLSAPKVTGTCLRWQGTVVHLSAFAVAGIWE